MQSILQKDRECLLCKSANVECHHVFGGTANRELSTKYGLTTWLCPEHHRGKSGVHNYRELDLTVKRFAQKEAMKYYGWSEGDFRGIFGKLW